MHSVLYCWILNASTCINVCYEAAELLHMLRFGHLYLTEFFVKSSPFLLELIFVNSFTIFQIERAIYTNSVKFQEAGCLHV